MKIFTLFNSDREPLTFIRGNDPIAVTRQSWIHPAQLQDEEEDPQATRLVMKTYWRRRDSPVKEQLATNELDMCVGSTLPPHPSILKGTAGVKNARYVRLVMPRAPYGSLAQVVGLDDLPLVTAIPNAVYPAVPPALDMHSIMMDVLAGLHHIHAHGYAHRDIKMDNILVFDDGVKLTDFGSVWRLGERTSCAGTLYTLSPEMVGMKRHVVTTANDIWSAGVVMCLLHTGAHPFLHMNLGHYYPYMLCHRGVKAWAERTTAFFPLVPTQCRCTQEDSVAVCPYRPLLLNMLSVDPDRRPTAQEALRFLQGIQKTTGTSSFSTNHVYE